MAEVDWLSQPAASDEPLHRAQAARQDYSTVPSRWPSRLFRACNIPDRHSRNGLCYRNGVCSYLLYAKYCQTDF